MLKKGKGRTIRESEGIEDKKTKEVDEKSFCLTSGWQDDSTVNEADDNCKEMTVHVIMLITVR